MSATEWKVRDAAYLDGYKVKAYTRDGGPDPNFKLGTVVNIWGGTSWVPVIARIWDGTEMRPAVIKRWSDTSWDSL